MERKLVTVRKVGEIRKHANADSLELAIIDGWQCVVKKDEFKAGDLVAYFEIDSLIPISEEFEFLRKSSYFKKDFLKNFFDNGECFRLRTVRLRKEISQGLIVLLPNKLKAYPEGTDISVYYGVHKYDPPLPVQLAGCAKGNFPQWGRKTDQERIQNLKKEFQYHYDAGTRFEVTVKLDGSSMSVGKSPEGELVVCSRNLSLELDNEQNVFVKTAIKYNLLMNLSRELGNAGILIQGELIGMGIQGNKENLSEHDYYVFDIFSVVNNSYIPSEERYKFCELFNLKHVPILHKSSTLKELGLHSIDDVLEYANGKSLFADIREGIVFKAIDGSFSFKAISNEWLLKYD